MVDGAAWLEQLKARRGGRVTLSLEQALTIARALASAQAMADGQRRMDAAIERIAIPH